MGVQLHQLRYVICVAEERQFTRAARRLHVAQPSVSSAVRELERELGSPLLHRSRGEVTLTAAGEAFLPWARQVLADCEAGQAAVRDLQGLRRGRLALGSTPSLMTKLVPRLMAGFHQANPDVELVLDEAGSTDLVVRLQQGELDLALLILPVAASWVSTTPLLAEDLVLGVHRGHRLASAPSVSVAALASVPLVMFRDGYNLREVTVGACRSHGFEPVLSADGLEMDGVLSFAEAGLGAAVIPASVGLASHDLVTVPFRKGELTRTIGWASRRDRRAPPSADAFMAHVGATLPQVLEGDRALASRLRPMERHRGSPHRRPARAGSQEVPS